MASHASSNQNLPFSQIPKLNAFLKSAGRTPPSRPGVTEYALWFNTYAEQIRPYHSLKADDRFTRNQLKSLKVSYNKIVARIAKTQQEVAANGEYFKCAADVARQMLRRLLLPFISCFDTTANATFPSGFDNDKNCYNDFCRNICFEIIVVTRLLRQMLQHI